MLAPRPGTPATRASQGCGEAAQQDACSLCSSDYCKTIFKTVIPKGLDTLESLDSFLDKETIPPFPMTHANVFYDIP